MDTVEPKLTDILAKDRTDLAVRRTIMAAERSLMAWVRTSLSMIAFGFTIYAFLQSLGGQASLPIASGGSRTIGLLLLALGMISTLFGAAEYLSTMREIGQLSTITIRRLPLIMAGLIFILGAFLFINVLIKVHFV